MYVGGYGIIGDYRNIAAWYGDDGIEFAKGNKAHFVPQAQVIPWLDVAKTIQSLLENGQFASTIELEEAPSFEGNSWQKNYGISIVILMSRLKKLIVFI